MNEYRQMSISKLKAEIDRCPCAHGKCYTDPRYYYALRLWKGEGITENKIEAFYYFKEAADHGHEGARLWVGKYYYQGAANAPDYEKALEYFKRLGRVHALSQIAYLWMGKCYLKIKERNVQEAFNCFSQVANDHRVSTLDEESHKEAEFLVGICYYYSIAIQQNHKRAIEYFEKAAVGVKGHLGAQYYLVKCFRDGIGTNQNLEIAGYWSLKCFERDYESIVKDTKETIGIND